MGWDRATIMFGLIAVLAYGTAGLESGVPLPLEERAIAYPLWHNLALVPDGTSPLMGEGGRGCASPNIGAKPPPPLIPPHKGEGVDWTIVDLTFQLAIGMVP
jgi:hypothetical protein